MTAHPIDTEALREQYTHLVEKYGPEAWAESRAHVVLSLLNALTRAETQSEARRINADYWKRRAERGADAYRQQEARIKAVEDVLNRKDADLDAMSNPPREHRGVLMADIRRALEGEG